jgi:hypothetical protein
VRAHLIEANRDERDIDNVPTDPAPDKLWLDVTGTTPPPYHVRVYKSVTVNPATLGTYLQDGDADELWPTAMTCDRCQRTTPRLMGGPQHRYCADCFPAVERGHVPRPAAATRPSSGAPPADRPSTG